MGRLTIGNDQIKHGLTRQIEHYRISKRNNFNYINRIVSALKMATDKNTAGFILKLSAMLDVHPYLSFRIPNLKRLSLGIELAIVSLSRMLSSLKLKCSPNTLGTKI